MNGDSVRETMKKRIAILLLIWFPSIGSASGWFGAGEEEPETLTELYSRLSPSVVLIEAKDPFGNKLQFGTGFYVSDGCKLVTNYHVINGAYSITLKVDNDSISEFQPKATLNKDSDLAIIQLKKCGAPLRIVGQTPKVGSEVFTIGNPRGLVKSLSDGLVSGIHTKGFTVIQTTVPISPGSSGGPLMLMDGYVIGITTAYLKDSQGLNFAVSSSEILDLLKKSSKTSETLYSVDYSDPRSVGTAFLWALHNKDYALAVSLVRPSDQDGFLKEFQGNPKVSEIVPKGAKIVMQGTRKYKSPYTDEVSITDAIGIEGSEIGIDLVKYGNRWWMKK